MFRFFLCFQQVLPYNDFMINTVIFDMDGLLVDSEKAFLETYNELLDAYGYSLSKDTYLERYCGKIVKENAASIVRDYHLDIDPETFCKMLIETETRKANAGYDLKPGAKELLDYLKAGGYKIVLATSSLEDRALTLVKQAGVLDYFDAIICGKDVKLGKPHPDVFLKAMEAVSSGNTESLVLEDSLTGVEAAVSAQVPVIVVPDMVPVDETHAAMVLRVCDSLYDVIDYLENGQQQ